MHRGRANKKLHQHKRMMERRPKSTARERAQLVRAEPFKWQVSDEGGREARKLWAHRMWLALKRF